MPITTISLTAEPASFVESEIGSGRCASSRVGERLRQADTRWKVGSPRIRSQPSVCHFAHQPLR